MTAVGYRRWKDQDSTVDAQMCLEEASMDGVPWRMIFGIPLSAFTLAPDTGMWGTKKSAGSCSGRSNCEKTSRRLSTKIYG
jgi:hypothetical protein